jgi:hypothetical protein
MDTFKPFEHYDSIGDLTELEVSKTDANRAREVLAEAGFDEVTDGLFIKDDLAFARVGEFEETSFTAELRELEDEMVAQFTGKHPRRSLRSPDRRIQTHRFEFNEDGEPVDARFDGTRPVFVHFSAYDCYKE